MLLWVCKREALRGLGVNTGEGNIIRHHREFVACKFISQLRVVSIISWSIIMTVF